MATPYFVSISGNATSDRYPIILGLLEQAAAGEALHELEHAFAALDEYALECFQPLAKYAFFFGSFRRTAVADGRFTWGWEMEAHGDTFLEDMLQLLDVVGLEDLEGESQGDEEVYRCNVTDEAIECEYHELIE
ncbi:hypothetical protein ACPA5B_29700 [Pseudomonas solani]|uniref:hypothetical protein n=1 Tax=Pseudomonas solani TaxID=2731552 RepID=UPI003C2CD750